MDFMPFGKHKGKLISDIPTDYLRWGAREFAPGSVQRQFIQELAAREGLMECVHQEVQQKPILTPVGDCYSRFNPKSDWPGRQDWDGVTAPWLDQAGYS